MRAFAWGALAAGIGAALLAHDPLARLWVALAWQVWAEAVGGMSGRGWRPVVWLVLFSSAVALWHAPGTVIVSAFGIAITDEGVHAAASRASLLVLWWSVGLGLAACAQAQTFARFVHWFAAGRALRMRAQCMPWRIWPLRARIEALAGLVALALVLAREAARLRWLRWAQAPLAVQHTPMRARLVGGMALLAAFVGAVVHG